ncbi:hypothetical protein EIP91_009860 [Steccherinum ochraceum]|uniref:Uncharacterized protein n=1 Tax=Steccherinum ochraceum TaxID=92696 RepID=A0A4V2MV06_9APHY|nr:hypothetical protein EIP91_009860 [Steccherinum ochraceum]
MDINTGLLVTPSVQGPDLLRNPPYKDLEDEQLVAYHDGAWRSMEGVEATESAIEVVWPADSIQALTGILSREYYSQHDYTEIQNDKSAYLAQFFFNTRRGKSSSQHSSLRTQLILGEDIALA